MLHKSITYTDIDNNEVTEDFWFGISRDEVIEKSLIHGGEDYLKTLEDLQKSTDGAEIMRHFKDILGDAVGKREGKLFIKNDQIKNHFMYSGAYGKFFMELLLSPDSGASWISSMLPRDAQKGIREEMQKRGMDVPAEETVELPDSGVIEGVVVDQQAQAEKPQPNFGEAEPTPFPGNLDKVREAAATGVDRAKKTINGEHADDPAWVQEMRNPTRAEMVGMSKEDLQLLFKMREAGVLQ